MKKKFMKFLMAFTALALFFSQYACAGSGKSTAEYARVEEKNYYEDGDYYAAETTQAAYENEYPDEAGDYEEYGDYSAGKANVWNEPDETKSGDEQGKDVPAATLDEKLVYTCTMDMETVEYEQTIAAIRELIDRYNGIIEHETYSDSANNWYYTTYEKKSGTLQAYIVVRIPSKYYRDFLSGMDGFGKVTRSEQNVENITRRYSETQTTIKSLETQEERLLEMMKEAETIEEMLAIEDRLTDVQTELQILKNRLSEMDTDVAYSTVNLNIREVLEYSPEVEPVKTLTFKDRLMNTLKSSWNTFTGFLEGLLFFLIEATPILLVIGGISIGIMFIIIGIIKGAKKRNARKAAKKQAAAVPAAEIPAVEKKNE